MRCHNPAMRKIAIALGAAAVLVGAPSVARADTGCTAEVVIAGGTCPTAAANPLPAQAVYTDKQPGSGGEIFVFHMTKKPVAQKYYGTTQNRFHRKVITYAQWNKAFTVPFIGFLVIR